MASCLAWAHEVNQSYECLELCVYEKPSTTSCDPELRPVMRSRWAVDMPSVYVAWFACRSPLIHDQTAGQGGEQFATWSNVVCPKVEGAANALPPIAAPATIASTKAVSPGLNPRRRMPASPMSQFPSVT